MLEQSFEKLYLQFRLNYLKQTLAANNNGDGVLSAAEYFCAEAAYLLGNPTVSEFAAFLNVSLPNANYKTGNLIRKGYLKKEVCEDDKREYRLSVTPKFLKDYSINGKETRYALHRIRECFTSEEYDSLDTMIIRISEFLKQAEDMEEKE
jgi:DNA-binding MarR family transcriptional regulator